MDRSRLVALVVGGVLALLFVTVATSDPARIADRQPSLPWQLPELELPVTVPTTSPADDAAPERRDDEPPRAWHVFTTILQITVLGLAALAVLHLLRQAWRNRPRLRWSRRRATAEFAVLDDVADAVMADAEAQQTALRTGSPRNAIVECWLRLESTVEDAGVAPDPALTAAEFTEEVLTRFDVDQSAAARLASLYREARFSTHPMDEAHRQAAVASLDAIHDGLRATRSVGTRE